MVSLPPLGGGLGAWHARYVALFQVVSPSSILPIRQPQVLIVGNFSRDGRDLPDQAINFKTGVSFFAFGFTITSRTISVAKGFYLSCNSNVSGSVQFHDDEGDVVFQLQFHTPVSNVLPPPDSTDPKPTWVCGIIQLRQPLELVAYSENV
jgi:hypothetical protein